MERPRNDPLLFRWSRDCLAPGINKLCKFSLTLVFRVSSIKCLPKGFFLFLGGVLKFDSYFLIFHTPLRTVVQCCISSSKETLECPFSTGSCANPDEFLTTFRSFHYFYGNSSINIDLIQILSLQIFYRTVIRCH